LEEAEKLKNWLREENALILYKLMCWLDQSFHCQSITIYFQSSSSSFFRSNFILNSFPTHKHIQKFSKFFRQFVPLTALQNDGLPQIDNFGNNFVSFHIFYFFTRASSKQSNSRDWRWQANREWWHQFGKKTFLWKGKHFWHLQSRKVLGLFAKHIEAELPNLNTEMVVQKVNSELGLMRNGRK
jgi:hypothetical protein